MLIGGMYHPFENCARILKAYLESTGDFDIEISNDRAKLTSLDGYDVVIGYTQGGSLTDEQEKGLLEFVRNGGAFVGLHSATASFKENEGYMEMIGACFVGHGPLADISVEVEPSAREKILPRLSESFVVPDELYHLDLRTKAQLTPCMYGWWQHKKMILGYTREYGDGKVYYCGLGHDERSIKHPDTRGAVLKGLRWACGMKERQPVRFGIVGYGPFFGMGKHHYDKIMSTDGFEVAAICDKDPLRLEVAREEVGAENLSFHTDAMEMAKSGDVDAAVVILPHNLHAKVAVPLLDSGLHVVVEKPMAVTVEECDSMIDVARRNDRVFSVYHSRHWDADMWTIRELVESGAIGQVYSIEHNMCGYRRPKQWWRSNKEISGGLLYDMGAHGFEKIFQITPHIDRRGNPCNRKATIFGNFQKKVWWDVTNEDFCRAYLRFDTGLEAQIVQSNIDASPSPNWVVRGTRGAIFSGKDGLIIRAYEGGAIRESHVPYVTGLDWKLYYWNLADHIFCNLPLVITPGLAKAAIQCIRCAEQSSRENRAIEVEFDF